MSTNRVGPGMLRVEDGTGYDVDVVALDLTAPEGFFVVGLDTFRTDSATDFDLYMARGKSGRPVLYREGHLRFNEEAKSRLVEHGVRHLLVSEAQRAEFQGYLEKHLNEILDDPRLPMAEKSRLVYGSAQWLVKEVLEGDRLDKVVERSRNMARQTANYLAMGKNALHHLVKVMSFDYYTYTHSVNVFVFGMSLASTLNLDNRHLVSFGQGALVHDIGKRRISKDILNWRGKLSPEQWDIMRKHPEWGVEILRQEGMQDELAIDVTLHHHEKLDGTGYPDGLKGDEISPWVRVLTISDIFDALTTRRAYKEAISTFDTLRLMREQMANHIDMDIFTTMVRLMAKG